MIHYEIEMKEVGKDHILHPSHTGYLTREEVIKFFGLNEPDVEWYKIKETKIED